MKVLVTGAPGFVGLNIVKALKDQSHEVVGVVRKSSRRDFLEAMDVTIVEGDVLDRNRMFEITRGIDAVIHTAGLTSGHSRQRASVFNTNVEGTRNIVDAAVENKVKRFVFTSTTSTIGVNKDLIPSAESTPLKGFRKKSQYGLSKCEAEKIVVGACAKGVETIILNPAEVMGPYDYHFGWGIVILGLHGKQLNFYPTGGGSFCHAVEVGKAHANALVMGRNGERYTLGGADVLFPDLIKKICELTGCDPLKKTALNGTYFFQKIQNLYEKAVFPLTRKDPFLDPVRLKAFFKQLYFSSQKAVDELDYKIRPIEDMIMDCFDWYKNNGFL